MNMMIFRVLTLLLALCASFGAHARGGGGGHVTTFDPNLFGGPNNVSCLKASIAGACNTGYTATCNGVADDSAAYTSFVTANIGGTAVLYYPPGTSCNTPGSDVLRINNLGNTAPAIKNLTVWGYGASWNAAFLANSFDVTANGTPSLINTTTIGDTSVTLKNAGDASKYSVGNWACVCGLELQHGGFPPNFQFHEFRLITSIVGSLITFAAQPLVNQYFSTWPQNDVNDGPAALWLMAPNWNSRTEIHGVTFLPGGEWIPGGKTVAFYDSVIPNDSGFAISGNQSFFSFYSYLGSQEIDKDGEFAYFFRSSGRNVLVQSPSPDQLIIDGGGYNSLIGWAKNTTIRNVTFTGATSGPVFGHGVSVLAENVLIPFVNQNTTGLQTSTLAFNSGTFSITKTTGNGYSLLSWGVPGQKYYFGDNDATPNCVNTPQSACTFTVTGLRQDGYSFVSVTGISNASPAVVTFPSHGLAANTAISFQQLSGSGSDSLPSPLVINTTYYVLAAGLTTNTFEIATSPGGAAINTTTAGSGSIALSSGNFYADTDIGPTLPTPTCNTHACPLYAPYAAATITQRFSGPADLTQYAAP